MAGALQAAGGHAVSARTGKPVVAVTGPRKFWRWAWWATRLGLRLAGAQAVYLHPGCEPRRVRRFDALVVGGGNDLDPALYGELVPPTHRGDPERDAFEMEVLRRALDEDLPILGICRGAQLLNVAQGGNLHVDITTMRVHTSNRPTLLPLKSAIIEPGSRLAEILQSERIRINSLHHQAIRSPGDGLEVVARDLDGIVQAVEDRRRRFRLGVQWHPEYLVWQSRQRRLFRALVAATR